MVRYRDRGALIGEGRQLADDVDSLVGHAVACVTDRGTKLRRGDVVLALAHTDLRLGMEGYKLRIGKTFSISAPTAAGVFYGGRTLLQLLREGGPMPRGTARDWPRYPERGLMLDTSRTVYPRRFIEAEIRQLAYLKLNLLHLHLTDDQRWGIESDTHPEIVAPNALTKADIREILAVAARYHVLVVPEIDMPGHSAALLAKHPALELRVGGALSSNAPTTYVTDKLDITNPAALALVKQLLDEYLPLFPGRYWDLGADEYMAPAQYPLYPQLAAYALRTYGPRASIGDAIHGFINWVDRIVRAHGKALRVWNDQLGGTSVVPVNPNVVVDWWINNSPVGDTATVPPEALIREGHRVLNAGWFPTYYAADIGPVEGKSNMRQAYEGWQVNDFSGPEFTGDVRQRPDVVSPTERHVVGSTINVFGPLPETIAQTAAGIAPRLAVIAQKTWNSPLLTPSYVRFRRIIGAVGSAPNATIPRRLRGCPGPSGRLKGLALGPVKLGQRRARLRRELTHVSSRGRRDMDFFCLAGGGIRAGYPSPRLLRTLSASARRRVSRRVVLALTADRYYALDGVRPLARLAAVAKRLRTGTGFRIGLNMWYLVPGSVSTGILKVRRGIIEEIGIVDRPLTAGRHNARRFLVSFD